MRKKFDISFLAIIALLVGVYSIIYNQYVYKFEKYYLGENLVTKKISVNKMPEYFKGNIIRPAHYTFTSAEFKNRFWISNGGLEEMVANKTDDQIGAIKAHDTLIIAIRDADQVNLTDSTSKIRVIDLVKNDTHLMDAPVVEKYDRSSYNLNMGIAVALLLIGITWQIWRVQKRKRTEAHNL